jgi:phosphoenolpyruvate synthase/pyruvate phosphate dikinase
MPHRGTTSHVNADRGTEIYKAARKIGLCGQAPSDYPEFAQFLVEQGIDSISLNPDAVLKTLVAITAMEQSLARQTCCQPG